MKGKAKPNVKMVRSTHVRGTLEVQIVPFVARVLCLAPTLAQQKEKTAAIAMLNDLSPHSEVSACQVTLSSVLKPKRLLHFRVPLLHAPSLVCTLDSVDAFQWNLRSSRNRS